MGSMTPSQDTGTYAIGGIPAPHGLVDRTRNIPFIPGLPSRQEFTAWYDDPANSKQVALYMLASQKFQGMSVGDKLSYFQISGIHGLPAQPWDHSSGGFYCQHNSLLFPTWHRPYMLLFEQRYWEVMLDIIRNDWKLKEDQAQPWLDAANAWRLPYWDWAIKQKYSKGGFAIPEVLAQETVTIETPQGQTKIRNPLYKFENPEKDTSGKPRAFGNMPAGLENFNITNDGNNPVNPWSLCTATSRHGILARESSKTRYTGLDGVNNVDLTNQALATANLFPQLDSPGTWADAVSRMFSPKYNTTWGTFASTKWNGENVDKDEWLSLEYVHNNLHIFCGGTYLSPQTDENGNDITAMPLGLGHMSDVPVAAFDPIFWLHHCNVDRLFAIWQALHWDLWWDKPEPAGQDTTPDATPEDLLQPFHTKANGDPNTDVYSSNAIRNWTKLGYQYDTLIASPDAVLPDHTLDETKYKTQLADRIRSLYGSTADTVRSLSRAIGPVKGIDDGIFEDYVINVIYDRYALDGRSYTINFFIGDDSKRDHLVGSVASFSGLAARDDADKPCPNCADQKKAKVLSSAQVHITIPLLQHIADAGKPLSTLDEAHVEAYLEQHLRWRFVAYGGEIVPADRFPDTKIAVFHGQGKDDVEGEPLPVFAGHKPIFGPTQGKAGGVDSDDPVLGREAMRFLFDRDQ